MSPVTRYFTNDQFSLALTVTQRSHHNFAITVYDTSFSDAARTFFARTKDDARAQWKACQAKLLAAGYRVLGTLDSQVW